MLNCTGVASPGTPLNCVCLSDAVTLPVTYTDSKRTWCVQLPDAARHTNDNPNLLLGTTAMPQTGLATHVPSPDYNRKQPLIARGLRPVTEAITPEYSPPNLAQGGTDAGTHGQPAVAEWRLQLPSEPSRTNESSQQVVCVATPTHVA